MCSLFSWLGFQPDLHLTEAEKQEAWEGYKREKENESGLASKQLQVSVCALDVSKGELHAALPKVIELLMVIRTKTLGSIGLREVAQMFD